MHIGIIGMSAKPFHIGHYKLIQLAANENDKVIAFVSLADRARKNEIVISGKSMETAWNELISKVLPNNVKLIFSTTPIKSIYEFIGKNNEEGSDDSFIIYSDPEDIAKSFSEKYLKKYFGNLFNNGQVILRPTERASTADISGTMMRKFISDGDKKSFTNFVPDAIDADRYWNILTKNIKSERLLKSFVSMTLKA